MRVSSEKHHVKELVSLGWKELRKGAGNLWLARLLLVYGAVASVVFVSGGWVGSYQGAVG